MEYASLIFLLAIAGLASGLAGGLFGIGGGLISVPALYFVFQAVGVDPAASLKTAIGSSLAVIIVTSWRALKAHRAAGHVDSAMLRLWSPWLAGGAALGGLLSRWAPVEVLGVIFALGALGIGIKRMLARDEDGAEPKEEKNNINLTAPHLYAPIGFGSGLFCALMGIGGGVVGGMAMTMAGRSVHQSIATASGIGMAVAAPGAIGFYISGLNVAATPPFSAGYINVPAFVVMAVASATVAPWGARLAHQLSGTLLSRLFGVYAVCAAFLVLRDLILG